MTHHPPALVPGLFFGGFFDDASLLPPGGVTMAEAISAHRLLRSRLGSVVGPLVVPTARLESLFPYVDDGEPLDLALLAAPGELPAAAARIAAHPCVRLAAVELPVAADARAAVTAVRALADVPDLHTASVELPRTETRDDVLDVLAGTRYRAKLRTGGPRAELFPSPEELAETLYACAERSVAVKCTAGLHRAVRHTNRKTGVEHHGFLNILLAAADLADGAAPAVVAGRLCEDYAPGLAAAIRSWSPERGARARAIFTSFGTCTVMDPTDDLMALGLLEEPG
ncbi:hypothetical protein [Paractinoplanes rishiriensis]|uniref:Uncharacterized protein n=1 Tax=Paractinoplanes rishiriensis TaxID=1050105 RepID=A0A919MYR2_9ACTN|nr:hypothetical protein [Actinoplanes rishiriensis]GIF00524.1 hypothetical protein Ari01nite_79880 [Actinoplanes rishiriensis]